MTITRDSQLLLWKLFVQIKTARSEGPRQRSWLWPVWGGRPVSQTRGKWRVTRDDVGMTPADHSYHGHYNVTDDGIK